MPLDRLITVVVRAPMTRDEHGEIVPGAEIANSRRWADLVDNSVARVLETGGARGDADRVYRVRYFAILANARPVNVKVTDDAGSVFTVTEISEETGRNSETRRRWLEMECTREAA